MMIRNLVLLFCLSLLTACSVVQATSGPEMKDMSVLDRGTERYKVLAELDRPMLTDKDKDGRMYDIFSFRQGQHGSVKAGKAVAYGAAAIFTLGLSEVITSPLEGAAGKGAKIKALVLYDAEQRVDQVELLQDDRWVAVQQINDK